MPDGQQLQPTLIEKAEAMLERVIDKVVTLRVTTVIAAAHTVGDTAVNRDTQTAIQIDPGIAQVVASTTIDMALGDYTEVIDPQFIEKAEYAKLHQDALALARTIRSETVAILRSIAKDIESHI